MTYRLLGYTDPDPVGRTRPAALSDIIIIADHAGNRVPKGLPGFGVAPADLARHIGYDIGILGLSEGLAIALDATLIYQRYSRLVIDCNRPPDSAAAMPAIIDGTRIPGNQDIPPDQRAARVNEIFRPYHKAVSGLIDRRMAKGRTPVIVAMHSFTPQHGDFPGPRPWHVGVLFNRDERLARKVAAVLGEDVALNVGVNQPYHVDDQTDYALPVHCERRGLVHVELEIRQDLIATSAGQWAWATRLADVLERALAKLAED